MEVIAERLYLIPAKGLLEKMKPVILEKFNGGEFKFIREGFELPSSKARFEIEAVVDDDCEVCPAAVEMLSELVAKFENVVAKIYNITYTRSPFEPIVGTPTFRINGKVRFTGIPLEPDSVNKFLSKILKKAYVATHPKLEWLLERIKTFAETYGYRRNPNDIAYMNLIAKLLRNIDEYGQPYCPCRPLKKVEGATPQQIYELNKDKVCPCIYAHTEVKTKGMCLCMLFWSKEKIDEYIRKRLEKYGWVIREVEFMQKALEELKKRVITGDSKALIESLINKLQLIYVSLPD